VTEPQPFLPQSELQDPIVLPPGGGKPVGVLGAVSTFKILPEQTGGAYAILEQEIPAGHGPPLHVHRHETEVFYILAGEFELTVGSEKISATAGSILVGPRDIPHTFRNTGPTPGKLLLTVIPGRFANYFRDVDGIPDHNQDQIQLLAASYGVEFLE
jgi:quercetin dioxygenase-like cupin family protein